IYMLKLINENEFILLIWYQSILNLFSNKLLHSLFFPHPHQIHARFTQISYQNLLIFISFTFDKFHSSNPCAISVQFPIIVDIKARDRFQLGNKTTKSKYCRSLLDLQKFGSPSSPLPHDM